MTASRLATKGRTVNLDELYAFVLATDELLMDASRLNSRLTVQAARAIRWKANDAIVYGTGAGQPLGFFSSAVLVSVAKEGSQAADTIVAANVLKMFSRLLTAGLQNVFWTVNPDVLPQLGVMTIGDQPIWTPPSSGLREAPGGFLLGRPVRFSEHNKTLGDKGDIFLIDPMGYYLTMKRGGVQSASSIHLYFDYNITAFRWTFRLGGQPHLSAPISPANGSATKSHFVTLDERA
jgi:HK97 family phage major capsid protein